MDTESRVKQADFADLVGCHQSTVSRMVADGILRRGGTLRTWLTAYIKGLETERDAFAGAVDDSAEARAARLALTKATTKLREQQGHALVREREARFRQYVHRVMGEVRVALYHQAPNVMVGRLLELIPRDEDRYRAADVFRGVIEETLQRIVTVEIDDEGFFGDSGDEKPAKSASRRAKAS